MSSKPKLANLELSLLAPVLSISYNTFLFLDIDNFWQEIHEQTQLHTLSIQYKINALASPDLPNQLALMPNLTRLELGSQMPSLVWKAFGASISANLLPTLETLYFHSGCLSEYAMMSITNMLKKNTTVTSLTINPRALTTVAMKEVRSMIRKNRHLQYFCLRGLAELRLTDFFRHPTLKTIIVEMPLYNDDPSVMEKAGENTQLRTLSFRFSSWNTDERPPLPPNLTALSIANSSPYFPTTLFMSIPSLTQLTRLHISTGYYQDGVPLADYMTVLPQLVTLQALKLENMRDLPTVEFMEALAVIPLLSSVTFSAIPTAVYRHIDLSKPITVYFENRFKHGPTYRFDMIHRTSYNYHEIFDWLPWLKENYPHIIHFEISDTLDSRWTSWTENNKKRMMTLQSMSRSSMELNPVYHGSIRPYWIEESSLDPESYIEPDYLGTPKI